MPSCRNAFELVEPFGERADLIRDLSRAQRPVGDRAQLARHALRLVVQIADPEHPGDVEWFDPKAAPKEEAVIDLYFHNATETLAVIHVGETDSIVPLHVYAWGNAEAFGGWPGQSFAAMDTTAILGLELIHTQITGFVGDT